MRRSARPLIKRRKGFGAVAPAVGGVSPIESLESRRLLAAVAVPDVYRVIQDTPLAVSASGVLANDQIASGNGLSVVSNTAPAHGTVALNANGLFTYTPVSGYVGSDAFDYTAADGQGNNAASTVSLNVAGEQVDARVLAGSRLASVNTSQLALLGGVLGGLLGTNVSLNVLDWNGLANGSVGAAPLGNALQTTLGLASPAAALNTNVTLAQVFAASASAAQAQGNTALANAFNSLGVQVSGLTGTVRLGDLLSVDPNNGSLADSTLNALDLVTGSVQLFNYNNVATTPAPVTISGTALGLQGVLNSVRLSAQVVEPPVYVRGGVGTQFHTAAVRLKLNLDIVDLSPNTSGLVSLLSGLGNTTVNLSLSQLDLCVDVARGSGTIAAINAIAQAVTLQGTPGVANAYLGSISDAVFSNRTRAINPATDLGFGTIGSLALRVAPLFGIPLVDTTSAVQIRSAAVGQAPLANTLVYNAPFPKTQTIGSSASFLSNLLSSLTTNLELQLTGNLSGLGALLTPFLNATKSLVGTTLSPVLGSILTSVVDPALRATGIGIGELVATVDSIGVQSPALANNDYAITAEDVPLTVVVLGDDAVAPGDAVTVTSVVQPAHGTVVLNPNGTVTYTPNANYNGPDSFTYTISNGVNPPTSATVTFQVTPVNDPPVALPNTYAATEDTPLAVPAASGVLSNDGDPDGDPLTALLATGVAHGTVTLNPDGSFLYTPAANYNGPDSFTYRASDGTNLGAPVTVTLNVAAVADAPVAGADAYVAVEDAPLVVPAASGVLANDGDADGNPLTALLVAGPAHGTLVLNPDGSFAYTPAAGYSGPDSFNYRSSDGTALGAAATVSLQVTAANRPPVALLDLYAATRGNPLQVPASTGVLANDSDPDGDPLRARLVRGPSSGQVALNPDGSFRYVPNPGFVGVDTFTYRAGDGRAESAETAVMVNVTAPPPSGPTVITVVDGIITIPGGPDNIVRIQFKWTSRSAAANNELGLFLVDDAAGTIGGVAPGSRDYRALAPNSPGRRVVFRSGERAGVTREFEFRGGQHVALYLVGGTTTARAIQGRAQVFFSQASANPDGILHARTRDLAAGVARFAWEDSTQRRNADFNDLVMSVAQVGGLPAPGTVIGVDTGAVQVRGVPGAPVTARYTLNRKPANARDEIGRFLVDDAAGRIGSLLPGDPGYAQAALDPGRQDRLFAPGQKGTKSTVRVVPGGSYHGFYVVANGTAADVLAGRKRTVFFSFDAANPDRLAHVRRIDDSRFDFETQLGRARRDFADASVRVEYF